MNLTKLLCFHWTTMRFQLTLLKNISFKVKAYHNYSSPTSFPIKMLISPAPASPIKNLPSFAAMKARLTFFSLLTSALLGLLLVATTGSGLPVNSPSSHAAYAHAKPQDLHIALSHLLVADDTLDNEEDDDHSTVKKKATDIAGYASPIITTPTAFCYNITHNEPQQQPAPPSGLYLRNRVLRI